MKLFFTGFLFALCISDFGWGAFSFDYYPMDGRNKDIADKKDMSADSISEKFLFSGDGVLRQFLAVKGSLRFSHIYFPEERVVGVGETLGLSSSGVSEEGWLGLFRGRGTVPQSGKFRFVGLGNDFLMVRVNGKAALDARGSFYPPDSYKLKTDYLSVGVGGKKRNLRAGPWINLSKGAPFSIEVLVGGVGDEYSAFLLIEQMPEGGGRGVDAGRIGMLENLALFSLGEVGSASEFPLGNAEGGGDSLSVKKILSFRGNVERHTFELPREERNAISAKEEPGDLDMGRGHLWEGDFHVHSVPWGKFKGVLTGWYQPSDRERRWEFRSLRIPETWGQRNTDNYFVVGDSKLDQKIVKERGMDTLSQTFVEGAFRQGNRETNTLLKVSMLYEADLFKTRLVRGMGTGPVEKLTGADRRRFLTLSFLSDVDRMSIRKWMKDNDLVRRTGERDLAFASRVQTFMVGHFVYNGERRMSIEDAIRFKGIACGESALLFGKIMRMNGIPARSRAGRWTQTQEKTPSGGDDIKVHVKVDFYAEGIGWLVVEFPYGEKNPQKIDECIGWDGDFLTIQIDPFVSKGVGVVFDQGFRGYSKGIVQPLVYEWWEVNSPKD